VERRSFLKKATIATGVGTASLAAPAIAQSQPTLNWRLVSSFPKSLDNLYGTSEIFANALRKATDGKFNIKVFAAGEIVPPLQVQDAVQNGTVEVGHTAGYYALGKDSAFIFDTAAPFGLTARQQTAWMLHGNGMKLMRELYASYNIVNFMGGQTGTQMGGWFRKEIKTVADLKGLKFRIAGFAGNILSKMGVVPQQLPAGEIYSALEKGTIDAAEFVGPYDDEKLGLAKVAKNYYYPAWWEGGASLSFLVNKKKWDELPPAYQAAWEAACFQAHTEMCAKYDALNPPALQRLLQNGAVLRKFNTQILDACFTATQEAYAEESAKNPRFKVIYEDYRRFRNMEAQWFNVAEQAFAQYSFNKKL
jgi:TRAP-type mannitol/chloroaromatic compound transport system substrate-binding protein